MAVFSFCSRPPGPCWWHGGSRKAARRLSPPHSSSGGESRKKPLNQRAVMTALRKRNKRFLMALFGGRKGPHIITDKDRSFFLDSPSYRRLVDSVRELDDEERLELNALGWLGAGRFPDWHRSIDHAEKMENVGLFPEYTAGYGHHWRPGYKRVMLEKAKAADGLKAGPGRSGAANVSSHSCTLSVTAQKRSRKLKEDG